MEPLSNEGMCRCCASEGNFKDFLTAYHWMGGLEIYADMLRDCFAITLYTSEDVNNGGICEVCITQLRNACNFKRQVQQTEEQFKKRLQDGVLKSNIIKLEAAGDDGEHSDGKVSDDYLATEYEVPVKEEKLEEKPKKRQAAKASTSRAKKAKTEDGEPSSKRVEKETSYIEITIKQEPASDSEQPEMELGTVVKIEKMSDETEPKKVTKDVKKSAADKKSKKDQILEMEKHLKNISTILLNTNATPIRYHDGINYVCALCPETYPLPSELKLHVLEEHDQIDKSSFMEGHRLTSYVVKLDITNLRCLICHSEIEGFDPLFEHLNTVHGKGLHTDIPNHILPFRFVGNGFDCVQCPKSFEHFKLIQEHMSAHYGNYICETCKSSFVNKRTMQNHANRHKKGDFPCSQCAKIFDTNRKKLNHEKFVHAGDYKRKKCPYCQEKFTNYSKKRSHMVKEHGAEPMALKCDICKKTFSTRARLRGHTRRDHTECQHACQECEMRFSSKYKLANHMLKHLPLRRYQCDICQKAFAKKYTLSNHLKSHANIRDFKCELCAYMFVHKCSWKAHMRNKHKVNVP